MAAIEDTNDSLRTTPPVEAASGKAAPSTSVSGDPGSPKHLRQPSTRRNGDDSSLNATKSLEATESLYQSHSDSTNEDPVAVRYMPSEIPLRIGDYFVIRELGRGGFGQVFLAKDPAQDRLVAIKVPRSTYTNSQLQRDQFLREARTAAALSHPHLTPVYDCRELPDGRCIVVMKYIEGRTLQDLMASERLAPRRAVEILAAVADALHVAHQRGVWHRDIKPANILLDTDGRPYLSDFGLAIHEGQQSHLPDELAGTYLYMSPEQVRQETRHLDGRTDIWSLGVILYELLTRRRPFGGGDREAVGEEILNREPKPPRHYDASIGQSVETVCLKCLRKNPTDRFATAAELASSLRRSVRPALPRRAVAIGACLAAALLAVWLIAGQRPEPAGGDATEGQTELPLRAIAWPTLVKTDFYNRLGESGRIAVNSSASMSCIETHRPATARYELQASVDFQSAVASAGLAVGIHETSEIPPLFRCLIIYVNRDFPNPGLWLKVEDCEIGQNDLRHMDFLERRGVCHVKLDDAPHPHFTLSVQIDDGRITEVAYNRRSLPAVVTELQGFQAPPNTTCGVMAMSHVVFHSLSCKELRR